MLLIAETDTPVSGAVANNAVNYVYTDGKNISYSSATPKWNAVKCGCYNGNSRTLLKFYYTSSGNIYGNKVILDGYDKLYAINEDYVSPASSGQPVLQATTPNIEYSYNAPAEYYRVELKGGKGGNGQSLIVKQVNKL